MTRSMRFAAALGVALLLAGGAAGAATNFVSTMQVLTAIYNLLAGGISVTMSSTSSPVTIVQSETVLAPATDATIVPASTATPRKYLCLQNIGANPVNLAFDTAATAGQGLTLDPAASGSQGGSVCWESGTVPSNAIHGISTAGSTVVTLVGN